MNRWRRPSTLLGIGLLAVMLTLPGCGNEDAAGKQPTQAYLEVLNSLEKAALSETTYHAVRHAKELSVPQKSVIEAFCETAWQLEINGETSKLSNDAYLVERIRYLAEYHLSSAHSAAVGDAMAELRTTLDLASIDRTLNNSYKRACYR